MNFVFLAYFVLLTILIYFWCLILLLTYLRGEVYEGSFKCYIMPKGGVGGGAGWVVRVANFAMNHYRN